jgi:putative addiction module component (TIGR02574 family)
MMVAYSNAQGGIVSRFAQDDILDLSISERIQLVEDLWDSIAKVPESIQLSEEQKLELDRRLDAYHSNPDLGSPWEVVRERIRGRK